MNRVMRVGTIAAAAVGAIVAVALIVKEQLTGPAPEPVSPGEAPPLPPIEQPAAPKAATGEPDDLSEINGIGPVYQTKLADAGITTFAALGAADASEIAGTIEAPVSRVQAWIDAARRR